jgi:eukaryotic-like serine/threonine-protein kinase
VALAPGIRIGPYEITALIGEGGMGKVWRAHHTALNRDDALKVLPDSFASDPDRVARFRREAQVLASLSHPNIAHVYGLELADGVQALIMELVEGPTLADRVAQGPIPVDEALPIAKQIAEALEAAHEQGIIHRDLKPANIKVRPDGTVKVLDFGLAKALEPSSARVDATAPPTITSPAMMTGVGVLLGTAAYMSPEQARGKAVDKRTDIWAFGCVLYEMLTGTRPFGGEDLAETIGAVIHKEPAWATLPAATPATVRTILQRCLEKDPKQRMRDVGDVRLALSGAFASPTESAAAATQPTTVSRRRIVAAASAALLVGAAGAALWSLRPPVHTKIARFPVVLPEDQALVPSRGRNLVDISRDGTNMVYVANQQLYLRRMADMQSRPIQGTDQTVSNPAMSPDGQWIVFWSAQDSTLKKIPITGGAAVTLCSAAVDPFGVMWDGDTIVFNAGASRGIFGVSANGGTPELLVKVESNEIVNSPQILPGGKAVLFTVGASGAGEDKLDIVAYSRETGQRKILIRGADNGRYSPTGHIIYSVGVNLLAVPFDVQRLQVTGGPVPVVEGVLKPGSNFGLSEEGTLVYVPTSSASTASQRALALAGRNGKITPLRIPPGSYEYPSLSRDGTQLAVQTSDDIGTIWIYNLSGSSSLRRLTFEGINLFPIWSPDGRQVAFESRREGMAGIFLQRSDGTGVPERLTTELSAERHRPESWSPDGKTLAFSVAKNASDSGVSTITVAERKSELFVDLPASNQFHAAFSPDSRWLAYVSDESGKRQVYVQPFPRTGAKYQVSREGADAPVWSPDGKELFYYQIDAARLVAVRVDTQPTFSFGDPVPLPVERMIQGVATARRYDIMPDGQRFLVILPEAPSGNQPRRTQQINVVLNWFEELKARVPAK